MLGAELTDNDKPPFETGPLPYLCRALAVCTHVALALSRAFAACMHVALTLCHVRVHCSVHARARARRAGQEDEQDH
eukprot:1979487-Rhodomonas_salina.1